MKKRGWLCLAAALILLLSPAAASADRYRVLDAALSMLEEGNPFLARYNGRNGADIRARYPLGCPYFWGGRRVKRILSAASPNQDSEYYKKDRKYLYGLDCTGFTRWVLTQAGYTEHDSISKLLNRSLHRDKGNYGADRNTGENRTSQLRVGDLLAMQHASGGYHIAMYIGTLTDFGYTRKTVPKALVPYLYYPLVIHCAGSSDYYERYRLWLEETGNTELLPPYGGVIVSLLDAPLSAAESVTPDILDLEAPCFDLEGYRLQILDISKEKRTRWIRWKEKP